MSTIELIKTRLWPIAWQVFSRLFIMLGLALLGWGIDDLKGFIANPVRATFLVIVLLQALLQNWMLLGAPPQPEQEHQIDLEHWQYSMVELIFILAAFGDRRNILTWGDNPAMRWVGLGIYLLGSSLATWASLTWLNHLRRAGWQEYENSALLTEGPFHWIRYPNLPVLFFYGFGFALAFRSWTGLAFVVPLIWMLLRRANEWDHQNAERHPKIWALRCQESKRIIPFLY
jgi:protein-S-isoprenylcysteine O-methyltransferase Ste14